MIKQISGILLFLFFCCFVEGQKAGNPVMSDQVCTEMIKEADRLFPEGHYDRCITDLEQVLKSCNLSRSEKEHTLELLAKSYSETGDIGKAETTVNLLLTNFPHYELKEAENSEVFNRLVRKYKIHPKLSIGVRNTADFRRYHTSKVYSVLEGLDYNTPYTLKGFGFMYYGWAELEFDKDISLNAELIWRVTSYDRNISKAPGFNLSFWEYDYYVETPISIRKYFHIGQNVIPYVCTGVNCLYMTKASGNIGLDYTKGDIVTGKNEDFSNGLRDINMLSMRNRYTFQWFGEVGIGYKIKNLRLFFDVRYYRGLNSFTNPAKRLNNQELINNYFYVDNSVKLNQFEIGPTISYTLINSVKRVKR